jgi:hypothetical protein
MPAGVSPWSVLDPDGPGRPIGDGKFRLRGYIIGWAVNADGNEIRFNHLKGEGTIVNYERGYAWEYNTMNHAVVAAVAEGAEPDANPGNLSLDGVEYSQTFDQLLLNFQAADSEAWSGPVTVISDTDVTLHPVSADLRQETEGPVTTKAHFTVWNMNEVKFSGAFRCITCWDQQLLSLYDIPDGGPLHFHVDNLQTDHGKARIDGLASQLCDFDYDQGDGLPLGADPRDIVSVDAAILGVSARMLRIDPGLDSGKRAASGNNLVGMGVQDALIQYDPVGGSPEGQELTLPTSGADFLNWLEREAGVSTTKSTGTKARK